MNGHYSNERSGRLYGFVAWLIPLYWIINQYHVTTSLTVGFVLLSTVCVFIFIYQGYFRINKSLLLMISIFLIHDIVKAFFYSINVNMWLQRIAFILFLSILSEYVDEELLYKRWKFLGIITIVALIYQSYQVYWLHTPVSMIKVLPISNGTEKIMSYLRPHAFFEEPATCVFWLIPLLFMSLKRKSYLFAIIVTFSMLLTTSTTGIFLSLILWGYSIFIDKGISFQKKVVLLFVIGLSAVFISNAFMFESALNKLLDVGVDSSSQVRLTLGYKIFADLDFFHKLVGIPGTNINEYLLSNISIVYKYNLATESRAFGYVNAISQSLLLYGLVGTIFYLKLFWDYLKNSEDSNRIFIIISFISALGQSVFLNAGFVLQFILIDNFNLADDRYYYFSIRKGSI